MNRDVALAYSQIIAKYKWALAKSNCSGFRVNEEIANSNIFHRIIRLLGNFCSFNQTLNSTQSCLL